MADKSKHRITIYPSHEEKDDGVIVVHTQKGRQAQALIQAVQSGHYIATTTHMNPFSMNLALKSMYYQTSKNNKIVTKTVELVEFNHYEKKISTLEHKGELTIRNLNDFLFSYVPVTVDEKDKDWFERCFDQITIKDDLIIELEFKTSQGRMTLIKKDFIKETDTDFVPYFNEKVPSIFRSLDANSINKYNHMIFEENKETYLKMHHYTKLGLQVYTTINPDENKVTPAVIVEDMNGNPLEVHCYYKNEYISKDILNELKPNILKEDFKAINYFNVRDIEFLDMVII